MRLFFLIPVATGVLSSYISLNSKDDISYIFGVIAALSLVLSLILAPWQIQLIILLLVLINLGQFLGKKNNLETKNLEFNPQINSQPQDLISIENNPHNLTAITINQEQKLEHHQVLKYRGIEISSPQNSSSLELIEAPVLKTEAQELPAKIKKESQSSDLNIKKKTQIKYRGVVVEVDSEN